MKKLLPLCALFLGTPAYAQEFSVSLGGKMLGRLNLSASGSTAILHSTLNQTPMGVFNGTFKGTSKGTTRTGTFTGDSQSSRKKRRVIVSYANGRAQNVDITPQNERTDLSDPALASGQIIDPVRAVAHLFHATACPAAVRLYDGRRVVAITPTGQKKDADKLICTMRYKVTAGPGHLSPLRISSAKMQLRYNTAGNTQKLEQIKISSGVFGLRLDRID